MILKELIEECPEFHHVELLSGQIAQTRSKTFKLRELPQLQGYWKISLQLLKYKLVSIKETNTGHLFGLCILTKIPNLACLTCSTQTQWVWGTTTQPVWFQTMNSTISSILTPLLLSLIQPLRNKPTQVSLCQNNWLKNIRSSTITKSNLSKRKKRMKEKCVTNKSSKRKSSDSDKHLKPWCRFLSQNITRILMSLFSGSTIRISKLFLRIRLNYCSTKTMWSMLTR